MLSFLCLQRDFEEGNWLLAAEFDLFAAAGRCLHFGRSCFCSVSGINMAKPKGFLTGTDSPTRDGCEQLVAVVGGGGTAVHRGGLRVGCPGTRCWVKGNPRGRDGSTVCGEAGVLSQLGGTGHVGKVCSPLFLGAARGKMPGWVV